MKEIVTKSILPETIEECENMDCEDCLWGQCFADKQIGCQYMRYLKFVQGEVEEV